MNYKLLKWYTFTVGYLVDEAIQPLQMATRIKYNSFMDSWVSVHFVKVTGCGTHLVCDVPREIKIHKWHEYHAS